MTEAATDLDTSVTNVSRAANRNGKTKGFRVVRLTTEEADEFRSNPFLIQDKLDLLSLDSMTLANAARSKPVLVSDGRVFTSFTECARELGVSDATVESTSKREGTCTKAGLTLYRITKKQEKVFRDDEGAKNKFLNEKKPKPRYTQKKSKSVLRSDGKIYVTKAAAARDIGAQYENVFRAIERKGASRGYGFVHITRQQADLFSQDKNELDAFVKEQWQEFVRD